MSRLARQASSPQPLAAVDSWMLRPVNGPTWANTPLDPVLSRPCMARPMPMAMLSPLRFVPIPPFLELAMATVELDMVRPMTLASLSLAPFTMSMPLNWIFGVMWLRKH